jgi:hypothetical protein
MRVPDPAFVVERYWPGSSAASFERVTARLASEIARLPVGEVTLLHSTYVPADETAQWVLRAPSARTVEMVCVAAGVMFERLLPAIESIETPAVE